MVFPSLFEGFGMPVLEAQTVGCPVACSNTTSLPEVAGDSALLFDPDDPVALAQIIADVAEGRIDREALRVRGLANVRRFTWDATFHATLDGYRRMRDY
jgi:alpha-1,3-rhamnosyl/mannosyltransferase